jgi:predicted MFS family arabinose efflux permease
VLADSSIVTLGLPDVLGTFDAEVDQVAWVLTAFNLALAVSAVPVARIARHHTDAPLLVGLVIFGASCMACALAPTLGTLIGARITQALGGAAIVCAALERLSVELDSDARAARIWGAASVVGVAVGPALGGILTQAFSWQAIFIVQIPVAAFVFAALVSSPSVPLGPTQPLAPGENDGGLSAPQRAQRAVARAEPASPGTCASAGRRPPQHHRPHWAANLALLLISAGLTAALFLLVLMLIEGWLEQPAFAGLAVTVMPLAALAAAWLVPRLGAGGSRVEAGVICMAGGLAALGLLPGASIVWTIGPQILIGAGLGVTIQSLTAAALRGRSPQAIHGGWTIAARHAGVVLGLLALTPIFTADLKQNTWDARLAGTALLLDSHLEPLHKIELGKALGDQIRAAGDRVPDVAPAFERSPAPPDQEAEQRRLQRAVEEQIARATTHSFSTSFLAASSLALLALVPAAIGRGRMEL